MLTFMILIHSRPKTCLRYSCTHVILNFYDLIRMFSGLTDTQQDMHTYTESKKDLPKKPGLEAGMVLGRKRLVT